jgi:signal transduction histidine kinase
MKEIMDEFDDYLGSSLNGNLHKEPITSRELFKMLETDYEDDLLDKHIKLKLKNNVKKGVLVVDINKLKRVFSNIISNSVRHMDKEEGIITITLNKKKDYFEFSISDNGEGIKEENIHKIFDPLFTTDPSRKISGLGLSICKQIIELHDGEIYARNNRNVGVTITFKIKDNKE